MANNQSVSKAATGTNDDSILEPRKPLVFVSHDSRDAGIAEAFTNLLTDASGGILRSFQSSDKKGVSGIEFGAEWYRTIMDRIENATDVVALLTKFSVDRPWILYEAGVAKGKLSRTVFGLALGIPLAEASIGPFAQFQNSADDEDSLTKLVLQLVKRNPDASPREEAVRRHVTVFRETVAGLLNERSASVEEVSTESPSDEISKLFEEVKVMFRELPERDGGDRSQMEQILDNRNGNPELMSFKDILLQSKTLPPRERATLWLITSGHFRNYAPGIYNVIVEVYRATMRGEPQTIVEIAGSLRRLEANVAVDLNLFLFLSDIPDQLTYKMFNIMLEPLEQLARELVPTRKPGMNPGAVRRNSGQGA